MRILRKASAGTLQSSDLMVVVEPCDALRIEMRMDPKVFILGEDVGVYGGIYGVFRCR